MKRYLLILLISAFYSCNNNSTSSDGQSFLLTEGLSEPIYDGRNFKVTEYFPYKQHSGGIVRINGKAFGTNSDSIKIFFGNTIAEIISLNDTAIHVKVPDIDTGQYVIKANIRDITISLNPTFHLVKSIYQYNHYEFHILNLYCERLQTNEKADTGVYSFSFKQPSWIINLSDKNTIRFLYPYYEPTYVSMILIPDSMFFKDIRYEGQYFGQSQRETIHNELTISKAHLDILSDTLLFAAIGHDELSNADFHFYRKRVYESGSIKNKYREVDIYNFLQLTDSSQVRIRLAKN
jgi:hypothetical protein